MSYGAIYASALRQELAARSRLYAQGRAHVESYGNPPVIVYAPEDERHGNFFDPAYEAIAANPNWMRRFNKVHAQAARSLPKPAIDAARRWRELDSCMSSDALLMNIFCAPGAVESMLVQNTLGFEAGAKPIFGWKAKVPLRNGRLDATEIDLRLGLLLIEAKLTESDFQSRATAYVEAYRDLDAVFDRELLPRVPLPPIRRKERTEFPEDYSQEPEEVPVSLAEQAQLLRGVQAQMPSRFVSDPPGEPGYAGYQLIRNVLAAHATGCSFCVIHDERRPDLREAWFQVMSAVRNAEMRVRLKVLTWQELAALVPEDLQKFLDVKYGIVAPGKIASPVGEAAGLDPI
jgi:hypothetical protein